MPMSEAVSFHFDVDGSNFASAGQASVAVKKSLRELGPEVLTFFRDFVHNPAPEGMEPLDSVVRRGGEFMEDRCRTGENILVSTHAIAMKGILEYLTPASGGSYWSKNIGNCAVYTAEYLPDGTWSVPVEMTQAGV